APAWSVAGDLAGLHQLFESAQPFSHTLRRLMAEQPRDGGADFSGRRVVLHPQADDGAAVAGRGGEMNRAGADEIARFDRAPGDQLRRSLVDDLGRPLDAIAFRPAGDPTRSSIADLFH